MSHLSAVSGGRNEIRLICKLLVFALISDVQTNSQPTSTDCFLSLRRHNRGKSVDKVREHSVPSTWALELTGARGLVPKLCICTLPKDFFVVPRSKSNQFGCPLTTGRPKCMAINVAKRVSHSDGRLWRLGSMP